MPFKDTKTSFSYIYNLFLVGTIVFFLWIFNKDYLTPLLMGLITATLTYPLYSFLSKKLTFFKDFSSPLSAILVITSVSILLLSFLNIFAIQLVKELPAFETGINRLIEEIPNNHDLLNLIGIDEATADDLVKGLKSQIENSQSNIANKTQLFTNENLTRVINFGRKGLNWIFSYLVYLVLFLLTWFYGLTTGAKWQQNIFEMLPFSKKEKEEIKADLKQGIVNVVYANILSGAIHAAACFIIMVLFGVPHKFILTVIVFLIGVLPLSPSELAYAIPIVAVFQTNQIAALIIIPISEVIILWVNYVLIPKIIVSDDGGNPLLILTSILSGISIFGIMGFIIGPVIMILTQTLYKILILRIRESTDKQLES